MADQSSRTQSNRSNDFGGGGANERQSVNASTSGSQKNQQIWIDQPVPSQNKRVYYHSDGTVIIKEGGHRSWRNNNEGNIRPGDFSKQHGSIGQDQKVSYGPFAVFPTPEHGAKAKRALIFNGKNYRNLMLKDAIFRYAPPKENNSERYYRIVRDAVKVDKQMKNYTVSEQDTIMKAMKTAEGDRSGKTTVTKNGHTLKPPVQSASTEKSQNQQGNSASGDFTEQQIAEKKAWYARKNYHEDFIKAFQAVVETKADGAVGKNTINKVAAWQNKNGITRDGLFGKGSAARANLTIKYNQEQTQQTSASNTGTQNTESAVKTPASEPPKNTGSKVPWKEYVIRSGVAEKDVYTGSQGVARNKGSKSQIKTMQALLNRALEGQITESPRADGERVSTKLAINGKWDLSTKAHILYYLFMIGKLKGDTKSVCVNACTSSVWSALRNGASVVYNVNSTNAFSYGTDKGAVGLETITGTDGTKGLIKPSGVNGFNNLKAELTRRKSSLGMTASFRCMSSLGMRKLPVVSNKTGQIELFAKHGPDIAAAPGRSNHQHGGALDFAGCGKKTVMSAHGKLIQSIVNSNRAKYNFRRFSGESWHYDVIS